MEDWMASLSHNLKKNKQHTWWWTKTQSFSPRQALNFCIQLCCCLVAQLCVTLCGPMDCSTPGFPVLHISQSFLEPTSIESLMPSNHLIPCRPLLLLPSTISSIRIFSNELTLCIRWPKYWSFSFSISPCKWIIQGWFPLGLTGLISLQPKGLSRVFSNTTVQKHQFFSTQPF